MNEKIFKTIMSENMFSKNEVLDQLNDVIDQTMDHLVDIKNAISLLNEGMFTSASLLLSRIQDTKCNAKQTLVSFMKSLLLTKYATKERAIEDGDLDATDYQIGLYQLSDYDCENNGDDTVVYLNEQLQMSYEKATRDYVYAMYAHIHEWTNNGQIPTDFPPECPWTLDELMRLTIDELLKKLPEAWSRS